MTYTFKLARRLAVSRHFTMLPVLLVLAACGGDATAPEAPTESPTSGTVRRDITPVTVQVNPSSVTAETNQLIQFRAHGLTSAGDSVDAAVTWSTSGGAILPDGRFSAAAIGTYTVIGLSRVRGKLQADSSLVTVVRRATNLVAVEVTPTSVSLSPGVSHTFTAVGRLAGGSVVPIGVNWGATGGSIDAGGTFVAGDTAGTYRVTATNTAGTLADTVSVTITAPPAPPPPPEPVLAKVTLWPASVTLAPGAARQFVSYGRTTTGDSVSVAVVFRATGGTVTSGGLFTAGSTSGSYRIIATAGTLADTSAITVTAPLGSGTPTGGSIRFGPFALPPDSMGRPSWPAYNATTLPGSATSLTDLRKIQAAGGTVVLMVPRSKSLIPTDPAEPQAGVISVAKATDYINTWPDSTAVAPYIADGTLFGVQVSDDIMGERIWGPCAPCMPQIDSIALAVKRRLGSRIVTYVRANALQLAGPDGTTGRPYTWKWLRGNWNQYSHLVNNSRFGPLDTYLANMLAANSRILTADGRRMCQIYGLNVLSGGDGSSGVRGGTSPSGEQWWQMSGTEIVDGYTALMPYTQLAVHWSWGTKWYPGTFEERADVRDAMLKVRALANNTPAKTCAP